MKLLLVSDEESRYIWDYFEPSVFKGVEIIISCGDLGAAYLEFLVSMIPAPLIYVPGNHDKKFAETPPEGCVNIDGAVYEHSGVRFFGMGGCKAPCDGVYEYTEETMKKRLGSKRGRLKRRGGVDVFVTHAPAFGVGDGDDLLHQGFTVFGTFIEEFKPKYHFFGHQHKRYGINIQTEFDIGCTKHINTCGYRIFDAQL